MGRRHGWAVGAALVAALTGCTTSIPGTPVADTSAEVRLDTGGYPTSPRQVPTRTGADVRVQPSFELGEYLIVPPDLQAGFDDGAKTAVPSLPSVVAIAADLGEKQALILAHDRYVGGAISANQRAAEPGVAEPPRMTTYLLRYQTTKAVDEVSAKIKALPRTTAEAKGLPGRPESFEAPAVSDGSAPVWYIPRGDYLLGVAFKGIPRAEAESLANRWVDRQIPKLAELKLTADEMLSMPADRDGILSYTIPGVETIEDVQFELGYMRPRTWAQLVVTKWADSIALMERAGVDLVGSGATKVFRARDAASARYYADAERQTSSSYVNTYTTTAAPAGVPGARCGTGKTTANGTERAYYTCNVVVGRYYAQTGSVSTIQQAHQQISAQYLILQSAK
ncbi:DUF7373 family lipoprotein [Tsukamurella ocularis]|uniref:DUF7373 family lipoprotein n=1 Tax=Tsukamurella ocularis TaxID=1970234 RepID=UPI0039EE5587